MGGHNNGAGRFLKHEITRHHTQRFAALYRLDPETVEIIFKCEGCEKPYVIALNSLELKIYALAIHRFTVPDRNHRKLRLHRESCTKYQALLTGGAAPAPAGLARARPAERTEPSRPRMPARSLPEGIPPPPRSASTSARAPPFLVFASGNIPPPPPPSGRTDIPPAPPMTAEALRRARQLFPGAHTLPQNLQVASSESPAPTPERLEAPTPEQAPTPTSTDGSASGPSAPETPAPTTPKPFEPLAPLDSAGAAEAVEADIAEWAKDLRAQQQEEERAAASYASGVGAPHPSYDAPQQPVASGSSWGTQDLSVYLPLPDQPAAPGSSWGAQDVSAYFPLDGQPNASAYPAMGYPQDALPATFGQPIAPELLWPSMQEDASALAAYAQPGPSVPAYAHPASDAFPTFSQSAASFSAGYTQPDASSYPAVEAMSYQQMLALSDSEFHRFASACADSELRQEWDASLAAYGQPSAPYTSWPQQPEAGPSNWGLGDASGSGWSF